MTDGKSPIEILPIEEADLLTVHNLSHAAFEYDSHTRFKMHEKSGTMDDEMSLENTQSSWKMVEEGRGVMLKAVNVETGELVGFTAWSFYNLDGSKDGDDVPAKALIPLSDPVPPPASTSDSSIPPLKRLEALSSNHLFTMLDRQRHPPNRVLVCFGISALPSSQSRGIGSLLIQKATEIADQHGASMWVHLSSDLKARRAFEKNGFEMVSDVQADLDQYRSKSLPDSGPWKDGWGTYTWRCMVRPAKTRSVN